MMYWRGELDCHSHSLMTHALRAEHPYEQSAEQELPEGPGPPMAYQRFECRAAFVVWQSCRLALG